MSGQPNTEAPLSPEAKARLKALSEELRCLVCQNQTLADSNAELAVDLRREVQGMIAKGDSDTQIKTYLVERYGDFVLYRPPVQANTMALWFLPFILLLIGAIAWAAVQRRSRMRASARATAPAAAKAGTPGAATQTGDDASPADDAARERARKILGFGEDR